LLRYGAGWKADEFRFKFVRWRAFHSRRFSRFLRERSLGRPSEASLKVGRGERGPWEQCCTPRKLRQRPMPAQLVNERGQTPPVAKDTGDPPASRKAGPPRARLPSRWLGRSHQREPSRRTRRSAWRRARRGDRSAAPPLRISETRSSRGCGGGFSFLSGA